MALVLSRNRMVKRSIWLTVAFNLAVCGCSSRDAELVGKWQAKTLQAPARILGPRLEPS